MDGYSGSKAAVLDQHWKKVSQLPHDTVLLLNLSSDQHTP